MWAVMRYCLQNISKQYDSHLIKTHNFINTAWLTTGVWCALRRETWPTSPRSSGTASSWYAPWTGIIILISSISTRKYKTKKSQILDRKHWLPIVHVTIHATGMPLKNSFGRPQKSLPRERTLFFYGGFMWVSNHNVMRILLVFKSHESLFNSGGTYSFWRENCDPNLKMPEYWQTPYENGLPQFDDKYLNPLLKVAVNCLSAG